MFEFLFRNHPQAETAEEKAERQMREYRNTVRHDGHSHMPPNIYSDENTASDRAVERAFRGRRGEA